MSATAWELLSHEGQDLLDVVSDRNALSAREVIEVRLGWPS
jgi:hypothetical protein